MTGLDTNVLVRYLVRDDLAQSRTATEFIEQRLTTRNPGFISAVVIAETACVLEAVYGFRHSEIAAAIERILQVTSFVVQHEPEVFLATTVVEQGGGSFADAFIGAINRRVGCSRTVTFDRKASRLPDFELLRFAAS